MVVALRKCSELPLESLAAGVADTRQAPAVAAPVFEGTGDLLQVIAVGQHAAALAHGDVVGGVKAHGREISICSNQSSVICRSDRVTAVFDQPEVMFFCERRHGREVKGVAQRMGEDHQPRAGAECRFQLRDIGVVRARCNVDEYRYQSVLNQRVDRGRESCCHGDRFVAGLQSSVSERLRRQRRHREQVGRRAGVDQQRVLEPVIPGKFFLKLQSEPAGREPEVEATIHQVLQLRFVEHPSRDGHGRLARLERTLAEDDSMVFRDKPAHFFAEFFGGSRHLGSADDTTVLFLIVLHQA